MSTTIGILAYGSLISDPGKEILGACTKSIKGVRTPFNVEFAHSSAGRGGAPTLVPVKSPGAKVTGQLFVLNLPEDEAADILYRREINEVGSVRRYDPFAAITENTVMVQRLSNFQGVDVALYTDIAANIDPLTAANLARLAMVSVTETDNGRDGISYLIAAKQNGIKTALSDDYEANILRQCGCGSLRDALRKLGNTDTTMPS